MGHRRLSQKVSDATSQPLLPLSFIPEVETSVKFQTFEEIPLSYYSVVMRRHHGQENSYKRKHLTGELLAVLKG